uniref:solute carrier family 22 member 5-like isoform X1 n=1 Tax=Styela clava TaxID=7725 RepID=UPI001939B0A9|nr:solute carrier family 22 member 5-like isoform X1 [Styela clava]
MDDVFEEPGSTSAYHKLILASLIITTIPQGMVNFSPVFVFHAPPHRCLVPEIDHQNDNQFNNPYLFNYIPASTENNETLSNCRRFTVQVHKNQSAENYIQINRSAIEQCEDGTVYDNNDDKTTATMEFNLVCDDEWKRPFLTLSYSIGALISGIIAGAISDKFGRRVATLGCVTILMLVIFGYSLAVNYWMSWFCFLSYGTGASITYSLTFVHAQELVKKEHRDVVACLINICMSCGYMMMTFIAYFCTYWRWIIRIPGFFCIFFMTYYCYLPESPRWLMSRGRKNEAIDIAKRFLKKSKFSEVLLERIQKSKMNDEIELSNSESKNQKHISFWKSLSMLFHNRILLKRILVLCWLWIVSFVCYFTFGYNTSNLGGSIYWNSFLSAAAEIPGWIVALFALKKLGRRLSLSVAFSLSAMCLILCPLLGSYEKASIAVAMTGKVFSSSNMGMVYLYTAELIPTILRSTGVGIASTSARVACLMAPFLAFSGEVSGKWIPFYVMGGLSLLAALLTLVLPETRHSSLPETLNDSVELEKFRLSSTCTSSGGTESDTPTTDDEKFIEDSTSV